MAKRPELERTLEERCVVKVEAIGGKALKLKLDGVRGFPDRSIFLPDVGISPSEWPDVGQHYGRVFFTEFKRAQVGVTSKQQTKWNLMLNLLGFEVYMVDTDEQFDAILERWR